MSFGRFFSLLPDLAENENAFWSSIRKTRCNISRYSLIVSSFIGESVAALMSLRIVEMVAVVDSFLARDSRINFIFLVSLNFLKSSILGSSSSRKLVM